jgi:hypothetical protein
LICCCVEMLPLLCKKKQQTSCIHSCAWAVCVGGGVCVVAKIVTSLCKGVVPFAGGSALHSPACNTSPTSPTGQPPPPLRPAPPAPPKSHARSAGRERKGEGRPFEPGFCTSMIQVPLLSSPAHDDLPGRPSSCPFVVGERVMAQGTLPMPRCRRVALGNRR